MSYEAFMRGLARTIARVEHEQDIETFDAQSLIDGIADTRLGPETREVLVDLCVYYAEAKTEYIYLDAFEEIMSFNNMEDNNEVE